MFWHKKLGDEVDDGVAVSEYDSVNKVRWDDIVPIYDVQKSVEQRRIEKLLESKKSIKLDLACGRSKFNDDWIGLDIQELPGVDIVHDMTIVPWPLPDECVSVTKASHIMEHMNPTIGDPRLQPLIDGLIRKGVITAQEAYEWCGETGPIFLRVMDELWRVTKVGGQVAITCPYSGSPGDFWDPTHIQHINETTWSYFDPEVRSVDSNQPPWLYWQFYQPKPWKVEQCYWQANGNLETLLVKRPDIYSMNDKQELVKNEAND